MDLPPLIMVRFSRVGMNRPPSAIATYTARGLAKSSVLVVFPFIVVPGASAPVLPRSLARRRHRSGRCCGGCVAGLLHAQKVKSPDPLSAGPGFHASRRTV